MLPRDRRVRTPAEFRHLGRTGTRAGRRTVVVSVATDPDQTRSTSPSAPRPRAGFVVSKAVGNAVTRNRVKRRLRAVVADQMRLPPLRDLPVLVQVRALPAADEVPQQARSLCEDYAFGIRSSQILRTFRYAVYVQQHY